MRPGESCSAEVASSLLRPVRFCSPSLVKTITTYLAATVAGIRAGGGSTDCKSDIKLAPCFL